MPITPLHFGIIPLLNRVTRRCMSEGAFVLANVVADIPVVLNVIMEEKHQMGGPAVGALHDVFSHNFTGVLVLCLVLGALGFKSARWWLGCVLGTLTHVGLDMFVHHDVQPFMPWIAGNPFYIDGAHGALSIVLCVGLAFWALDSRDRHRMGRQLTEEDLGGHPSKAAW